MDVLELDRPARGRPLAHRVPVVMDGHAGRRGRDEREQYRLGARDDSVHVELVAGEAPSAIELLPVHAPVGAVGLDLYLEVENVLPCQLGVGVGNPQLTGEEAAVEVVSQGRLADLVDHGDGVRVHVKHLADVGIGLREDLDHAAAVGVAAARAAVLARNLNRLHTALLELGHLSVREPPLAIASGGLLTELRGEFPRSLEEGVPLESGGGGHTRLEV